MNLTSIVNKLYFQPRRRDLERYINEGEAIQREILQYLVKRGKDTEYGRNHLFSTIKSYEDFAQNIPVNTYEELKDDIDRMRHGEKDILWPGQVKWYAKSSGTTNDKSKFIPITHESLQTLHYQGGKDVVAYYLSNNPNSRLFSGKGLILGGSHSSKEVALLSDFEVKRDRIARETLSQNVTNISGVPSWMLSVLVRVMELTGKQHLQEVWPNLEVFFHGGIAFTPYRKQYEQLITKSDMKYMETYNASEGFFGIQDDPNDESMSLMLDYGVFYEFLPMDEFENEKPNIVPLEGVEVGRNYAMLISTACGLWRYEIGDTVRFTSTRPYKFVITGRTKYFINAFGEELIMDNAEKGLETACKATGAQISEYTAAPIFMDANAKCRHQWLIEFTKEPNDIHEFERILDSKLQEINSDYEAKRFHNITLQQLEVVVARKELFNDWLKSKGKLGGQHKVPRLSNNRKNIEEMLSMNKEKEE